MNMTTTEFRDAALATFIDDAISDEDLGYPNGAAIVPGVPDKETALIVWRYLHEGRPAVLVGPNEMEMLIAPIQLGLLGRIRNGIFQRVTVQMSYRYKDGVGPEPSLKPVPSVRADIGRHALGGELAFAPAC
jgi:hypothetical protein